MIKFLFPLLVFAVSGFSQGKDAPKVDPSTGLPKKVDKKAKLLADILQGANVRQVKGMVVDRYGDLDARLKESLETKLKLGMKRNKLSFSDFTGGLADYSKIAVNVGAAALGTRVVGYTYRVSILRFVKTFDGKSIDREATWIIDEGQSGNTALLKEDIETTLDKIFLAYLELPEKKPKK